MDTGQMPVRRQTRSRGRTRILQEPIPFYPALPSGSAAAAGPRLLCAVALERAFHTAWGNTISKITVPAHRLGAAYVLQTAVRVIAGKRGMGAPDLAGQTTVCNQKTSAARRLDWGTGRTVQPFAQTLPRRINLQCGASLATGKPGTSQLPGIFASVSRFQALIT